MAVTETNIRDLLNYPKGLNSGTISAYITMRTEQVNKVSRSTTYLPSDTSNAVTTAQKEECIKSLVCQDVLAVLIDTIPTYVPEEEQRANDIRLRSQMRLFKQRADQLLNAISESGGSAYVTGNTVSRIE